MYEHYLNFNFEFLMAILFTAALLDLKFYRIPNILSLGGIALGLLLQGLFQGGEGLVNGLGGLAVGFFLFLPCYMLGGMGAGDVKLMATAGAFLSPMESLFAVAYTLICGGFFAVLVLVLRKRTLPAFCRYPSTWGGLFISGQANNVPPQPDVAQSQHMPYALAIATGTLLSHFHPLFLGI